MLLVWTPAIVVFLYEWGSGYSPLDAASMGIVLTVVFLFVYFVALAVLTSIVKREFSGDLWEVSGLSVPAAVAMGAALFILWDHQRQKHEEAVYDCVKEELYEGQSEEAIVNLVRSCFETTGDDGDWYDY